MPSDKRQIDSITAHFLSICLIICVWGFTHSFSINWGLPNPECFAIDTMPSEIDMTPFDMMNRNNFQYPPLQYLFAGIFCPSQHDSRIISDPELISKRSDKIFKTRLLSAVMALLSSLLIYIIAFLISGSLLTAFLAPSLYMSNPLSIYYSNTSNMDQPYTLWWILSYLNICIAERVKNKRVLFFVIFQIFAGISFALAFCTKDQVYSLYVLPLMAYLFYKWKTTKSLKIPFLIIISWLIPFIISTAIVYRIAGGWDTFITHFKWITNQEHQILYSQCAQGLSGRFIFIIKSIKDLFFCLEWPMALLLLASIIISLTKLNKSPENKKNIIYLTAFFMLSFISLEIFYIQVARFSFPRYYLPLIIPASLIIAGSFRELIITKQNIYICLFILLFICNSILALQFISSLNNDSRTILKQYISSLSLKTSSENTRIALTGCTNMRKVAFRFQENGDVHRKYVLVNEPLPTFGLISKNQKSIHNDLVSLFMYNPDIVITKGHNNPVWNDELNKCGYSFLASIEQNTKIFPSFFKHDSPLFNIHIKKTATAPENIEETVKKYLKNTAFEENLMRLAHYVDIPQIDRQLILTGKFFPPFKIPDINSFHINAVVISFLADSYESAERLQDASETWNFIKKHFDRPDLIERYSNFFERHPELIKP